MAVSEAEIPAMRSLSGDSISGDHSSPYFQELQLTDRDDAVQQHLRRRLRPV